MNTNNPPSGYGNQLAWCVATIQQLSRRVIGIAENGTGTGVDTVFGRSGNVIAEYGDYPFSFISTLPNTIAGYGITDGVSTSGSYNNPTWLTFLAWSKISGTPTTLSGYGITDAIPLSQRGVNSGVATLDITGKVPLAQLPTIGTQYKGLWNAATNTPTLANGTGIAGDFYFANVSGTTNFGAGSITFAINDIAIYNGTIWQKNPSGGMQVNSDWTALTGAAQILNKPTSFTALAVNMSTAKILGRWTAGSGIPQEITISTGLNLDASGNLSVTAGSITIDNLGAGILHTIVATTGTCAYDGNNGTIQNVVISHTPNTNVLLTNLKIGIPYTLLVQQDGGGNKVLVWGTTIKVAYNGLGTPPISTGANTIDKYSFIYDGTTIYMDYGLGYN